MPQWVAPAADTASILGLLISIWVLLQTYAIKSSFIFRIRLPESRNRLEELTSLYVKSISSWPGHKTATIVELSRIRAVLVNVSKKLSPADRKIANELLWKIRVRGTYWFFWQVRDLRIALGVDELWEIYGDLMGIIEMLNQTEKDSRWN